MRPWQPIVPEIPPLWKKNSLINYGSRSPSHDVDSKKLVGVGAGFKPVPTRGLRPSIPARPDGPEKSLNNGFVETLSIYLVN